MPIPKSYREVLLDVPQWLLKRMVKVEPSPVVGGDGEGVYYVGKFSDTWAPDDLRNREFYYAHAKAILSPGNFRSCKNNDEIKDPAYQEFANYLAFIYFKNVCGPSGSNSWQTCYDPQFESSGAGCFSQASLNSYDYSSCYSMFYAPAMFIFSAAPSSYNDMTNLVAYAKPCPVYSSTPSLSGKAEMSGKVLVRAVGCYDTSNSVSYVRYTSEDKINNSYTISYIGMGEIASLGTSVSIQIDLRYPLSASVTKGATDYYYYIYTIGFQYQ